MKYGNRQQQPEGVIGTLFLALLATLSQASVHAAHTSTENADAQGVPTSLHPPMSASMKAVPDQEIAVNGALWVVSGSSNPQGTFALVGNATDPAHASAVLHIYFADTEPRILEPRQVAHWNCNTFDQEASLKVKNAANEVIHAAQLKCGDALYLSTPISK